MTDTSTTDTSMNGTTRRRFLATAALGAGVITVMPWGGGGGTARAAAHAGNAFETPNGGTITVNPVEHASVVLETPAGTIYVDPVGEASAYEGLPAPDLVVITHQHGDHYSEETLAAIAGEAPLVVNPAVMDMLSDGLKSRATAIGNGESTEALGVSIDAIPAYNTTEGRLDFHPEGRDNGYVMTIDGARVYVSGDTEDIPEMRALENIDLAFVCMNLPFTMEAGAAADAVAEFKPRAVYPYHYRGRDGGTQDPEEFARLVGEAADGVEVKLGDWY